MDLVFVDLPFLRLLQRSPTFAFAQTICFNGPDIDDAVVTSVMKDLVCLHQLTISGTTNVTDAIAPLVASTRTLDCIYILTGCPITPTFFVELLKSPREHIRLVGAFGLAHYISGAFGRDPVHAAVDPWSVANVQRVAVEAGAVPLLEKMISDRDVRDTRVWESALTALERLSRGNFSLHAFPEMVDDDGFAFRRCLHWVPSLLRCSDQGGRVKARANDFIYSFLSMVSSFVAVGRYHDAERFTHDVLSVLEILIDIGNDEVAEGNAAAERGTLASSECALTLESWSSIQIVMRVGVDNTSFREPVVKASTAALAYYAMWSAARLARVHTDHIPALSTTRSSCFGVANAIVGTLVALMRRHGDMHCEVCGSGLIGSVSAIITAEATAASKSETGESRADSFGTVTESSVILLAVVSELPEAAGGGRGGGPFLTATADSHAHLPVLLALVQQDAIEALVAFLWRFVKADVDYQVHQESFAMAALHTIDGILSVNLTKEQAVLPVNAGFSSDCYTIRREAWRRLRAVLETDAKHEEFIAHVRTALAPQLATDPLVSGGWWLTSTSSHENF